MIISSFSSFSSFQFFLYTVSFLYAAFSFSSSFALSFIDSVSNISSPLFRQFYWKTVHQTDPNCLASHKSLTIIFQFFELFTCFGVFYPFFHTSLSFIHPVTISKILPVSENSPRWRINKLKLNFNRLLCCPLPEEQQSLQ